MPEMIERRQLVKRKDGTIVEEVWAGYPGERFTKVGEHIYQKPQEKQQTETLYSVDLGNGKKMTVSAGFAQKIEEANAEIRAQNIARQPGLTRLIGLKAEDFESNFTPSKTLSYNQQTMTATRAQAAQAVKPETQEIKIMREEQPSNNYENMLSGASRRAQTYRTESENAQAEIRSEQARNTSLAESLQSRARFASAEVNRLAAAGVMGIVSIPAAAIATVRDPWGTITGLPRAIEETEVAYGPGAFATQMAGQYLFFKGMGRGARGITEKIQTIKNIGELPAYVPEGLVEMGIKPKGTKPLRITPTESQIKDMEITEKLLAEKEYVERNLWRGPKQTIDLRKPVINMDARTGKMFIPEGFKGTGSFIQGIKTTSRISEIKTLGRRMMTEQTSNLKVYDMFGVQEKAYKAGYMQRNILGQRLITDMKTMASMQIRQAIKEARIGANAYDWLNRPVGRISRSYYADEFGNMREIIKIEYGSAAYKLENVRAVKETPGVYRIYEKPNYLKGNEGAGPGESYTRGLSGTKEVSAKGLSLLTKEKPRAISMRTLQPRTQQKLASFSVESPKVLTETKIVQMSKPKISPLRVNRLYFAFMSGRLEKRQAYIKAFSLEKTQKAWRDSIMSYHQIRQLKKQTQIQESGQKQQTRQKEEQITAMLMIPAQATLMGQIQQTKQAQAQKQVQQTKQAQAQKQVQAQKQIMRLKTTMKLKTIPKVMVMTGAARMRQPSVPRGLFIAVSKKYGKLMPVSAATSLEDARRIGMSHVRNTLAASFGIMRANSKELVAFNYPGNVFRPSKRDMRIAVQKSGSFKEPTIKGARLASYGERAQIKSLKPMRIKEYKGVIL